MLNGIQLQRGLDFEIGVPSVGGTVSIFTKGLEPRSGSSVQQVVGNDAYTKTTVFSHSTGLNDNGWKHLYYFLSE